MKNFLIKSFLVFTIFFISIILFWNYQDQKDFDKVFKVVEGNLLSPVAVTDVKDVPYINGQSWYYFRRELKTDKARIDLDSILKPFWTNRLSKFNDTIPSIEKNTWNKLVDEFDKKTLQKDTFLIQARRDTIRLSIKQVAIFQAEYIFGIKDEPYLFSLSINEWNKPGEKIVRVDDTLRFEYFKRHILKVNELFDGVEKVKVSFKKLISERHKKYGVTTSNKKYVYLIEKTNGRDLYKNETGFELLGQNEEYYSWWDGLSTIIIFWGFVIIWVYLAFLVFISFIDGIKGESEK